MAARTSTSPNAEISLALAMISSSVSPLLLLDGELKVVMASASFCRTFEIDPIEVAGRSLLDLGRGEWDAPQLRALLETTADGAQIEAYELDLEVAGQTTRRLVLNAHRLTYGDGETVRLLVAIADITAARAGEKQKDDLLREKAILMQELQHRVANSLQIIASVLLQNARKVQSEETRLHLREAHQRVMSVAALQQHLAVSQLSDVALTPYFTKLCKSIGASMIHDPKQLTIEVVGDASRTTAEKSVSLGLIVTELVINALKHAFPDHRGGKIVVAYSARGPTWALRVSDNGVGMPTDPESAKPGLGSSIVEALAKQLAANVTVEDMRPGTAVSIVNAHLSAIEGGVKATTLV